MTARVFDLDAPEYDDWRDMRRGFHSWLSRTVQIIMDEPYGRDNEAT